MVSNISQGGWEEPASVAETHGAVVFFAGDRAYKMKKPVKFDFLDFSTPEKREAVLRRELELNRRLAPDVYLDVVAITGSDGKALDHMLVMKRMPKERRLSHLVESGSDVGNCLREIARKVAIFHLAAETSDEIATAAAPDIVAKNWDANFEEMGRFVGPVLPADLFARTEELARRYVAGRGRLFESRMDSGRIVDGHGDLLATDIFCFEDAPPEILDCIEFNDVFRWGDVIADAAFLAMDLEGLGRPDLAAEFMTRYHEFMGEVPPQSLVDHYVAYRAQVRSKVACLRADQGDESAAIEAVDRLETCRAHLESARVRLVLVGGLPGTGKSTVAAALSDELGWPVIRSDVVRKELAGVAPGAGAPAAVGEGIYAPAMTSQTYEAMISQARTMLNFGESVILDASWTSEGERSLAADMAEAALADLIAVQCACPAEIAAERMEIRAEQGRDASDADASIASAMAEASDPWPDAASVDTSVEAEVAVEAALELVRRA